MLCSGVSRGQRLLPELGAVQEPDVGDVKEREREKKSDGPLDRPDSPPLSDTARLADVVTDLTSCPLCLEPHGSAQERLSDKRSGGKGGKEDKVRRLSGGYDVRNSQEGRDGRWSRCAHRGEIRARSGREIEERREKGGGGEGA
jgi:hypothetical protein